MPAEYISAQDLLRVKPSASCCDCGREVDDAAQKRPEEVWTIWHQKMIYCPKCAKYEGIGYEG